MRMPLPSPILEIEDVFVHFPVGGGLFRKPNAFVHAVDGVSLLVKEGEIVGIVGESGCGKTTLARAVTGLASVTRGSVKFRGAEFGGPDRISMTREQRRDIQMVFQDPFDSLNPRKTVFQTLAQPLRINKIVPTTQLHAEAARLLDLVGLSPGANYLKRYPHQFSGGQRQRICIARAIATRPRLVVADEAVSALDISIRAQILRLMRRLQLELKLSYLFITHDLGVVRSFCDRLVVMYLGRVVEQGPTEAIFAQSRHPYTAALLSACPVPDPIRARSRNAIQLAGDIPTPIDPPPGCRFHTRCPIAEDICRTAEPPLHEFADGHASRCHFADEAESWRLSSQKIPEVQA
jgi:oligopeptide/dipeptide ABC transporter ATP-binding protein